MVHFAFFKINGSASHPTTWSLPQVKNIMIKAVLWRKQKLRLIEKWWN